MTLIAGDLLADAEALAYPYVNDRAVAPGPLLRTLSTLDAEVTGMVVSVAPHLCNTYRHCVCHEPHRVHP